MDFEKPRFERKLTIHTDWIRTVRFSPNQSIICTGGNDKKVILTNLITDKPYKVFKSHKGAVCCSSFSSNGKLLATSSKDKIVRVWSGFRAGIKSKKLEGHLDWVYAVQFFQGNDDNASKKVVSGSHDKMIKVWDIVKRTPISTIKGCESKICAVEILPNNQTIASGEGRQGFGRLRIFDIRSGKNVKTLSHHKQTVRSVHHHPDKFFLATAGFDNTCKIVDYRNYKQLHSFEDHSGWVREICFHPSGNYLVSCSEDKSIKFYDLSSSRKGKVLYTFDDHYPASVLSVHFSPSGSYFASSGSDGKVFLWKLDSKDTVRKVHVEEEDQKAQPQEEEEEEDEGEEEEIINNLEVSKDMKELKEELKREREKVEKMRKTKEESDLKMRELDAKLQKLEKKYDLSKGQHFQTLKRLGNLRLKLFKINDEEIKLDKDVNKVLGSGGFGVVYEAEWMITRTVAVKEVRFPAHIESGDDEEAEIIKEFQNQIALVHPCIVRVYGYSKPSKGVIRIVMEKMDMNLFEFVKKMKPPLAQKVQLFKSMIEGLHFLHSQNPVLIHRDIKSFNFLVSKDGKDLKITDFGMLKTKQASSTFVQSKNQGTARWIAPEIIGSVAQYSVYSDIYALAITFWEVLYEKFPYLDINDNFVLMYQVKTAGLRPKITEDCPTEFKNLLRWMWDQEPRNRPDTEQIMEWFEKNETLVLEKYKDLKFPS